MTTLWVVILGKVVAVVNIVVVVVVVVVIVNVVVVALLVVIDHIVGNRVNINIGLLFVPTYFSGFIISLSFFNSVYIVKKKESRRK